MAAKPTRRSYGTGALFEKADKTGRVSYYGQWWQDDRQIKRVIGLKRVTGSRDGFTKSQAEKELQRLMAEVKAAPRAPRT